MAKRMKKASYPSLEEIQQEMSRVRSQGRYHQALRSTVSTIIVVAALAVLVAALLLPVLRVTGTSMQPAFQPGDIIVAYKTDSFQPGDLCCFYYNNKLIVKRVIAMGGDKVEIDEEGRVAVNDLLLEEPYVSEYDFGQCDLDFPYTVPQGTLFVLGDNRPVAVDSRSINFGCINTDDMAGKIMLRVWPLNAFEYFGM
ncbi:MAG: signal peptidase I [Clostridia bacterium]|nr:signal peptidase I [Clostridia bacterium]